TSIGLVINAEAKKRVDLPADQLLRWGIERCPFVKRRLTHATWPETTHVAADFSYTCEPFAGPGYFMVGDAATFLDPIFSSGVCLAMMSGRYCAEHLIEVLRGKMTPEAARK